MWREELPVDHSQVPLPVAPQPLIDPRSHPREFGALLQAWRDEVDPLPLYGKPNIGSPTNQRDEFGYFRGFDFAAYGDHVRIPSERIFAASPGDFDIDRNMLSKVMRDDVRWCGVGERGGVQDAWRYRGLAMATSDLLQRFPPADGRNIPIPSVSQRPPIEQSPLPATRGNASFDDGAEVRRAQELIENGECRSAREAARVAVREARAVNNGELKGHSLDAWIDRVRGKMRRAR
jgi:hypothetical protein